MACRKRERTPMYQVRSQNREAAMVRLRQRAREIPADTLELHLAIKRHLWLNNITALELAGRLRQNIAYVRRTLSLSGANKGKPTRILPPLLNRICEALGVDPETRQRWHVLGALSLGWEIGAVNEMDPLEREHRFFQLRRGGCVCCQLNVEGLGLHKTPLAPEWDRLGNRVEIHHLNEGGGHGGKRRGDRFTIPLCTWHHRGIIPPLPGAPRMNLEEATAFWGPSWACGSRPFRAVYGTDTQLLVLADALVGGAPNVDAAF